jgi:hypothetical protein
MHKLQSAFLRHLNPPCAYALPSPPRIVFYLEKPLEKKESKIRSKVHDSLIVVHAAR